MTTLVKIVGGYLAISTLIKMTGDFFSKNILVSFKAIKKSNIEWEETNLKLTMSVENKTDLDFTLSSFLGSLTYGAVQVPIQRATSVVLKKQTKTELIFEIAISNFQFLEQVVTQIESGAIPALTIRGKLKGGLGDKTVTVPITQQIAIL